MKVVTVHRGSRDGYQVSRALAEAGLLESLVTDLYWPGDRPWARRVEQMAPYRAIGALSCRYSEGLPSRAVKAEWLRGIAAYLAYERRWLPFDSARKAVRWCDADLGRRAGRIAKERRAALLSYSYYGHTAFSNDGGNPHRILFQLHPHPASVRAILRRERELHPDCASSLDKEWELALPEADYRQLVEEAGMAHHLIAASTFTKNTLIEAGISAERIAVVPYGIDSRLYVPRSRTRAAGEPLRLLFVGTLAQRKGIKYLIQALESLPPDKVELTVCGRAVDDLALFRNTSAPIRLFPNIAADGLLDAYRAADVFVFPSLAEGFAQVILEAMASGLPVISTTRTAAPDLIRHGQEGFVIEPGSALELARHIEEFLRRPEILTPMREAARRRAEYFTWRRFRVGIANCVAGIVSPTDAQDKTSAEREAAAAH